jgi:glycosyltransferase involved in cell wall biosynthesis
MPRKKKHQPTIFVQIASYRDPELLPTIRDVLDKADYPENLRFGIAWQHSPYETFDDISEYLTDSRFRIIDIDYRHSKGACWARNLLQQEYDGEDYTLQLDSHHRFAKGWDTECINMITQLQKMGHDKPLLTSYIPSYDPENDPEGRVQIPWKMNFDRFIPEGAIFFLPASIDNYKELDAPIPARFYSAHFAFTLGSFVKEVPHDPEYYFHGEEISIAVRAFTHGYDLFHPHKVVAWHEYTRNGRTKQWDDDPTWGSKNEYCHLKNRKLFEMDGEVRDIDFGIYGFGSERTLADYERYAGINFKTRAVQQYTLDDKLPPNPNPDDEYLHIFKHCIDIGYHQVPHDDYTVWAVAFEDENGIEIYRHDALPDEIHRMKNDADGYCKLWRTFHTTVKPRTWIVWPHSEKHGWCERLTGLI